MRKEITSRIKKDYPFLIDQKTGIINHVFENEIDDFQDYYSISAIVNDSAKYDKKWLADRIGSGTTNDYNRSLESALGEAIERYCGNIVKNEIVFKAKESDLKNKKVYNTSHFIQYSEKQYKMEKFPFKKYVATDNTYWVNGKSLKDGCEKVVPANLIWVNYLQIDPHFPRYNFPHLSGIAAGKNIKEALLSAISEIIERDSTMKWWIKGVDSKLIKSEVVNDYLSFSIYELKSVIPTIAAFLWDDKNDLCNVGFATRFDFETAVTKAKSEAIQLRQSALRHLNSTLYFNKSYRGGPEKYLKPKSKSRNYKQIFRDDFKDMYDLVHNTQYYLDPEAVKDLKKFRQIKSSVPSDYRIKNLEELIENILNKYEDIIYVDITTQDAQKAGYTVVRVLIPGMIPNAPTAYPPLGMFDEGEFNLVPLPHS